MILTRRRLAAAVTTAGVLWLAGSAAAQCCIPADQAAAGSPDAAKIGQCIQTHAPGLKGEFAAIKRARSELLCPLRSNNVSVAFRLEYSGQLLPVLAPLMTDTKDETALNAIRIAGELATTSATQALAAPLRDPRPAVRLMAADALGRTFAIVSSPPVALTGQEAAAALDNLERAIAAEQDQLVLIEMISALDAAMQVPESLVTGLRSRAMLMTATAMGKRAQTAKGDVAMEATLSRAASAMQNALLQVGSNVQAVPPATLKEIGALAGDTLAYAVRRVDAGNLDPASRSALSVLVTQAENLYILVAGRLGSTARSLNLGASVANGNDAQFRRDALNIIGGGAGLTAAPFDLPPERFIPKR